MTTEEKKHKYTIIDAEMTQRLETIEKTGELVVGGETDIDDSVIAAIVGAAAGEVDGIASLGSSSVRRTLARAVGTAKGRGHGVDVEAGKKEAILDITVNVIYGFVIPNVIIELRQKVATRLLEMVGLIAKEINVDVVGIEFPERMPGKVE